MKKRLTILPLLALAAVGLASCGNEPGPNPGPDPDPEIDESKLGPESWTDLDGNEHARVSKVESGKSYYLGYFRSSNDEIRVTNGEPHTDKKGDYPFYLGTSSVNDAGVDELSTVEIVGDGDTFKMKMHLEGSSYDDMYIGVYKAKSSVDRDVFSIHMDEDGTTRQQTFTVESGSGTKTETNVTVYYDFSWLETFDVYAIQSAVLMIQDERVEEEEPAPKFLGSGTDSNSGEGYISIDCEGEIKAMDESYNIAHFFEI